MAEREGGQWNVVATKSGVRLERVSDGGEPLFDDVLESDEARQLGELLTKHAAKAGQSTDSDDESDDSDEDRSDDSDNESDDSRDGDSDSDSDEKSDGD